MARNICKIVLNFFVTLCPPHLHSISNSFVCQLSFICHPEEVLHNIYCISSVIEYIIMEVSQNIPIYWYSVTVDYNGIFIILYLKTPALECIFSNSWSWSIFSHTSSTSVRDKVNSVTVMRYFRWILHLFLVANKTFKFFTINLPKISLHRNWNCFVPKEVQSSPGWHVKDNWHSYLFSKVNILIINLLD